MDKISGPRHEYRGHMFVPSIRRGERIPFQTRRDSFDWQAFRLLAIGSHACCFAHASAIPVAYPRSIVRTENPNPPHALGYANRRELNVRDESVGCEVIGVVMMATTERSTGFKDRFSYKVYPTVGESAPKVSLSHCTNGDSVVAIFAETVLRFDLSLIPGPLKRCVDSESQTMSDHHRHRRGASLGSLVSPVARPSRISAWWRLNNRRGAS